MALGRIDVGLVRLLPEPFAGLASCVMRENLALALPHEHPLTARRRPALRDLEGEPFIMYSPDGPCMHALLSSVFRAAGVRPRVVQALSEAQPILALVSTGMGLALVPAETRTPASTTSPSARLQWPLARRWSCTPRGVPRTATRP